MGLRDTFGFSSEKYLAHLQKDYSDTELVKKYRHKNTLICLWSAGTRTCFYFSIVTFGASLAPAVYSARQRHIVHRQQEAIADELVRRGLGTPRERKRDKWAENAVDLGAGIVEVEVRLTCLVVLHFHTSPLTHNHCMFFTSSLYLLDCFFFWVDDLAPVLLIVFDLRRSGAASDVYALYALNRFQPLHTHVI
jgi:hypothetical protein